MLKTFPIMALVALFATAAMMAATASAAPIVYEGTEGPGKGKHIVFIASDHEYKSEETLPALARILAKHHGFKCTVVFGVDAEGYIKPGANNVPGIEALRTADLMVIFTRFQSWPDEQMKHFVDYLDRAGPIVGLRTATHAFRGLKGEYAKYNFRAKDEGWTNGFGRQILGETWAGHYGGNHKSSTRIDVVPEKKDHPINRGVKSAWAYCGGYFAKPLEPSNVIAVAQPLAGMKLDSPNDEKRKPVPAAWTRSYKGKGDAEGRVFTSTYGASDDIVNEGYRRQLINGCFWAVGLEDAIKADLNIAFVGELNPTFGRGAPKRARIKPSELADYDSPIFPKAEATTKPNN